MCGISGIIRAGEMDSGAEIRSSLSRMAHRGPDDSGVWTGRFIHNEVPFSLGLGHVRLSILDLSEKGHQPMSGRDGSIIVLNGEIYNYLELKEELSTTGVNFDTGTDTEVVLAAYHKWGESCVDHFVGMWAFAIWDGKRLFLSRDRMGKKPLYIYHAPDFQFLAFASEIKGLKDIHGVPWMPDEETVYRYLAFAETERDGHTFYENIRELPSGSSLIFIPGENRAQPYRYWRLPDQDRDVDEVEAVRTTTTLLYDSVRLRLRSDAPLGLSLSGGLDSTLLLSLVNEAGNNNLPVFSSGYTEPGYNETRYIDIATRTFSCRKHAADTDSALFARDFERLLYHLDQPSKLPGPYSQLRVADLARQQVKVLIDGQGADELAGGYMYFFPVMLRRESIWNLVKYSPDLFLTFWGNRYMFTQYPLPLIWERLRGRVNAAPDLPLQHGWTSQFKDVRPAWEKFVDINPMIRNALTNSSLPALLRYSDRDNMAFGIENRSPFLDHRLVEYVSALPAKMKIRGGTTKWIFRAVAKKRVPKAIVNRRLKMGFPTPVGEWLKRELADTAGKWLNEYAELPFFRKYINIDGAFRVLDAHVSGKADHQALLWRLLSTGCWLKTAGLGGRI